MAAAVPASAIAAPTSGQDFHLPSQPLGEALLAIGKATNTEILFRPQDVEGVTAPAIDGHYSVEQAVRSAIGNAGLTPEIKDGSIFIRGRSTISGTDPQQTTDIVVTGTRIQGGSVASPVIQLSQQRMRDEGLQSLSDVLRSIPQNFAGGQMPGIGLNASGSSDETGGASLNLRGIGADATLTLLDGHRLPYSGDSQAIDISSIPFLAVDRIEIVPDGASALYGSDAVAGVGNIILKRDYVGLTASSDWGGSTDGGDNSQRYALLAGTRWRNGSVTAAYEYARNTPILAEDRSYTRDLNPGAWLYPAQHHNNASIVLRQDIADNLTFTADAIYDARASEQRYAIDQRGQYLLDGIDRTIKDHAFTITPSLKWHVSPAWSIELSGSYGQDHSRLVQNQYFDNAAIYTTRICFCNASSSAELSASGPIFSLPGGDVDVAFGGGYRDNSFHQTNFEIDVSQKTYYGYGEIDLPFVSPAMDIRWIRKLLATAAIRYERYPGIDDVLIPKFGLIYSPSADLDIKGSWGKSFKAPTLYQRYYAANTGLYTAQMLGGTGYPATATVLETDGGNPDLKPERATTWSATVSLHPVAVPGLHVEATGFGIVYRDRVITPIGYLTLALSDPIYADLVQYDPSDADKASTVAAGLAAGGFVNATSAPYDPANVVAIVRNNNVNAARQSIHGVDVSIDYSWRMSARSSLLLTANGTYLDSDQKRSALQPVLPLAGTIFNPPHFRGRAGVTFKNDNVTLSSFLTYVGGVRDVRYSSEPHVRSMTSWDLSAHYRLPDFKFARAAEIGVGIDNVTNAKPGTIAITGAYQTAYDTTNYSPFGRAITGSLLFRW